MDNYIASASDVYSSSGTSIDVKNSTKKKKKLKEEKEMKELGRKPSSVTSSQGKKAAKREKIMKSSMEEKSTSFEKRKPSCADYKT
eukprot:12942158-Ditylum_brightwellii.AAC.1